MTTRVAVWTPLPPDPSGIADYNARLLPVFARREGLDVTAVVRDSCASSALAGVDVIRVSEYRHQDFDLDVYHLGNHHHFHGYQLQPLLRDPGVVVLHDPAIADYVESMLGHRGRHVFVEEVAYNLGRDIDDPEVAAAIARWDRLAMLMSRRVVTSSRRTLVHSVWARDVLRERFGDDRVDVVPFALDLGEAHDRPPVGPEITFGVFGNLAFHKRVPAVLRAFAAARRRGLDAQLIIAGRRDYEPDERLLHELIDEHDLADRVIVELDVAPERFAVLQARADVVVSLRHPTAGETSASLLECFALATPAIVSASPQNLELPDDFTRKISLDPTREIEELTAAIWEWGQNHDLIRDAGRAARAWAQRHCDPEATAESYHQVISEVLAEEPGRRSTTTSGSAPWEASATLGVNVIGSWAGATGLAEAARRSTLALLDAGVTLSLQDVGSWARTVAGREPARLAALPRGLPYRCSLTFVNVNEIHMESDDQLRGTAGEYLVAMWYWELPALPAHLVGAIDRVDEIWVASTFVRDVFLRYTTKPVHVMPVVVEPEADETLTRRDFGLPEDATIFLVTFDVNSTIARKNPYGAIRAFEAAFGTHRRDVILVVKVVHLDEYPVVARDLAFHVERLGGILIAEDFTATQIASLIRLCDVYVSLHRSEGLGLGLAEAMYFARPVLATANSGNMDFMTTANSSLVGYSSRVIEESDLVDTPRALVLYEPGNLWAEPDLDDAARQMKWLADNPSERRRLGDRAASDIRRGYSTAAAGLAMRERLHEIASRLDDASRR